MKICLNNISKRYRNQWVFKSLSYTFESAKVYALLGANGSGKSTLLRIIAGIQDPSKGSIDYFKNNKIIDPNQVYKELSFSAPAMDIIEEMTLKEFLTFHFSFKTIKKGMDVSTILKLLSMQDIKDKYMHEFSSGMKQRVKLAQAFFAETSLLFLDEPCSNLDIQGVILYEQWLRDYTSGRMVLIASNDEREYKNADFHIKLADYK